MAVWRIICCHSNRPCYHANRPMRIAGCPPLGTTLSLISPQKRARRCRRNSANATSAGTWGRILDARREGACGRGRRARAVRHRAQIPHYETYPMLPGRAQEVTSEIADQQTRITELLALNAELERQRNNAEAEAIDLPAGSPTPKAS